jgi:hypothetical protein
MLVCLSITIDQEETSYYVTAAVKKQEPLDVHFRLPKSVDIFGIFNPQTNMLEDYMVFDLFRYAPLVNVALTDARLSEFVLNYCRQENATRLTLLPASKSFLQIGINQIGIFS